MPAEAEALVEAAEHYFREEVTPVAQEIDLDPIALGRALDGLYETGVMALKRPAEFGGPAANEMQVQRYQIALARASGILAFLATQHQSAVGLISQGTNDRLKAEYLPQMAEGGKRLGIGFSQLRRAGPPIVTAVERDGGYLVNGHVPWVTGHTFYREFVLGASLGDGQAVMGVVPLETGPGIRVNPAMKLAAMEAAQTVTVDFKDFHLPAEKVVAVKPQGWISQSDHLNIALQGYFALGCAQAGIDIVAESGARKDLGFVTKTAEKLQEEWEACKTALQDTHRRMQDESTQERLEARAWVIDLAVRCAHAAVTSSSGASNSLGHPAQRVYREALVFTVSAQTTKVMETTLHRLTARR